MIYFLILGAGGIALLASMALGWENGCVGAVFGTPVVLFLTWLVLLGIADNENDKANEERMDKAKQLYDLALKMLALKPDDPDVRTKCLESGRLYYELAIPDTQTMQGNRVIFTTDNSANRETRIQADINARTGHLKAS